MLTNLNPKLVKDMCLDQIALNRGLSLVKNHIRQYAVVKLNLFSQDADDHGLLALRSHPCQYLDEEGIVHVTDDDSSRYSAYLAVIDYTHLVDQDEVLVVGSAKYNVGSQTVASVKLHVKDDSISIFDCYLALYLYLRHYAVSSFYTLVAPLHTFGRRQLPDQINTKIHNQGEFVLFKRGG